MKTTGSDCGLTLQKLAFALRNKVDRSILIDADHCLCPIKSKKCGSFPWYKIIKLEPTMIQSTKNKLSEADQIFEAFHCEKKKRKKTSLIVAQKYPINFTCFYQSPIYETREFIMCVISECCACVLFREKHRDLVIEGTKRKVLN